MIVRASNRQAILFSRPYITITLRHTNDSTVTLLIKNTGKSSADKLKLMVDKAVFQLSFRNKEYDLSQLFIFNNVIPSFPPETEFAFPLMSSVEIQSEDLTAAANNRVFTLVAEYFYGRKRFLETTTIDLRTYHGIWMPHPTVEDRLDQLTGQIKDIKDILKKRLAP
jgi:hypothetical protein